MRYLTNPNWIIKILVLAVFAACVSGCNPPADPETANVKPEPGSMNKEAFKKPTAPVGSGGQQTTSGGTAKPANE